MATEIEPLIMPFNPLWVTTSKREYREAVRRMGEEPGDTKGKDGLTSCIPGKGCVVWISRKVKAPDLYALAAHEATHAACDMLASIGEDTPAAEDVRSSSRPEGARLRRFRWRRLSIPTRSSATCAEERSNEPIPSPSP